MTVPRSRSGRQRRAGTQEGSATLEFILVAIVLMVPLAYVLLSALQVQRTAFGAVEAARSAARAFVTAPTTASGWVRATEAVSVALGDQAVPAADSQLHITCSRVPCLSPGVTVRVEVDSVVRLPGMTLLGSGGAFPVRAVHVQTVDPFEPGRP